MSLHPFFLHRRASRRFPAWHRLFLTGFFAMMAAGASLGAAEPPPPVVTATASAIPYYEGAALEKADAYQKEMCKLDITYPANRPGFATVIWFHGGGLTGGHRGTLKLLPPEYACVAVDYRLAPKAELPAFLDDAAASTAWVLRNISKYGGDPKKVFVSGHSAGAYLAAMIGMDPKWLAKQGASNAQLAGIIPVSGQMTTHFEVKKLLGDTGESLRPLIDEYAPLYYASKNLPPICLITGDRRVEFKSRVEENELLNITLLNLGHPHVEFYEMGGLDHLGAAKGGQLTMAVFLKKILSEGDHSPAPEAKK